MWEGLLTAVPIAWLGSPSLYFCLPPKRVVSGDWKIQSRAAEVNGGREGQWDHSVARPPGLPLNQQGVLLPPSSLSLGGPVLSSP